MLHKTLKTDEPDVPEVPEETQSCGVMKFCITMCLIVFFVGIGYGLFKSTILLNTESEVIVANERLNMRLCATTAILNEHIADTDFKTLRKPEVALLLLDGVYGSPSLKKVEEFQQVWGENFTNSHPVSVEEMSHILANAKVEVNKDVAQLKSAVNDHHDLERQSVEYRTKFYGDVILSGLIWERCPSVIP